MICIIGVMFAILIFNNKGVYAADAGSIVRAAERSDTKISFHRYGEGYIPKAGDIFILCTKDSINNKTNKSDWRTHVGFVSKDAETENGKIKCFETIEGNANDNNASKATVAKYMRTIDKRAYVVIDENGKEKIGEYNNITARNRYNV